MTPSRSSPSIRRRPGKSWALAIAASLCLAMPLCDAAAASSDAPDAPRVSDASKAQDWTLDKLMWTLAQNKSGHASFVETKYLSIAAKPIESSGELSFAAPDHLEKLTVSPKPERLVVDGDKLTIERNQRAYTIALTHYPELEAFIESIRATLAGNRYALERIYRIAVGGHGDEWTLTLIPLDSRMLKAVRTVTLDGTRDRLHSVVIELADGDRSVMQLRNATRTK